MVKLYQGILKNITAGVLVEDDIIVKTAPIFNWSRGFPLEVLSNWLYNKGGRLEEINGTEGLL
jgi:hypothetical protein